MKGASPDELITILQPLLDKKTCLDNSN